MVVPEKQAGVEEELQLCLSQQVPVLGWTWFRMVDGVVDHQDHLLRCLDGGQNGQNDHWDGGGESVDLDLLGNAPPPQVDPFHLDQNA